MPCSVAELGTVLHGKGGAVSLAGQTLRSLLSPRPYRKGLGTKLGVGLIDYRYGAAVGLRSQQA